MKLIAKIKSAAAAVLLLFSICVTTVYASPMKVYPGGVPFGVRMRTGVLSVTGFSGVETVDGTLSPAYDAGIREGDEIVKINGNDASQTSDLADACADGKELTLECKRGSATHAYTVTPVKSVKDGKYRIGVLVKDGTTGIGTVTFIIPETLAFAGLGHGICDRDTGELEKLIDGAVFPVNITGVELGTDGHPGALLGDFFDEKEGTLVSNTDSGVFGLLAASPEDREIIETCDITEVKPGEAEIRCTLDEGGVKSYKVNIADVEPEEKTNKNFIIEVTDEKLIEISGGIVQGMSGSPIIQNGRLVGAVTHVFVSDPKQGYGISVENMMRSAPDILV